MSMFPGFLVWSELGLLIGAGFALFRRRGYPFSEAIACAVVTAMVTLSFLLQACFLIGRPELSFVGETILVLLAAGILMRERRILGKAWSTVKSFFRGRPATAALLVPAWAYLFALAMLIPPSNPDSLRYHLTRVLLFQQEGSLLLDVTAPHQAHRSVFPVGGDILSHLWLRFYSDYGVAAVGFLSYLAIAFGSYALARRHATPAVSLTASLVVLSLPELVYQATSTKNDIVMAVAGLFCFLLAHRLLERPAAGELALLILGLAFGVSVKTLFLGFALFFVPVFGLLLARRHPVAVWRGLLARRRWWLLALLLPVLVLSQGWLFLHNYRATGGWLGPPEFTASSRNHDGVRGAAANLVRYAHQVPDFLKLGDRLAYHLTGRELSDRVQSFYDSTFEPIFQQAGTSSRFRVSWTIDESKSWFGPLGFLIVLPAVGYALARGPGVLRALALVLLGYVVVLAWQVEWMQWNSRFFSIFFAGGGACVAVLLRRLPWLARPIEGVSILILFHACAFNEAKPLLPLVTRADLFVQGLVHDNVWVKTGWGRDRYHYYGDARGLEAFARSVAAGARVGLLTSDGSPFYHYLLRRPDARFVPLPRPLPAADLQADFDHLLCIGLKECDTLPLPFRSKLCHTVDRRWNDFCLYALRERPDDEP